MNMKRFSVNLMDALTAEDIGKFPDSNLANSLQCVSGITASYENNEGSKISVRGLDPNFNLVTLNGRQMPIANFKNNVTASSRALDFSEFASENIAAVEVFKTSSADKPAGAIGALVNIKTSRPFDFKEPTISLGLGAVNDTSNVDGDSVTPEISGMFSRRFFDDSLGVLVSGSWQERHSRIEEAQMNWRINPVYRFANEPSRVEVLDFTHGYPKDLFLTLADQQRLRKNGQIVLQYSPTSTLVSTFDYTFTELNTSSDGRLIESRFRAVLEDDLPTINDQATAIASVEREGGLRFSRVEENQRNQIDSVGINLQFKPSDNFQVQFDAHVSEASLKPEGRGNRAVIGFDVDNISTMNYRATEGLPVLTYTYSNNDESGSRDQVEVNDFIRKGRGSVSWDTIDSRVEQAQLSARWGLPNVPLLQSISLGVSSTRLDNRSSKGENEFFDPFTESNLPIENYDINLFEQSGLAGILDTFPGGYDDAMVFYGFDFNGVIANNAERLSPFDSFDFSVDPYRILDWDRFAGPAGNSTEDNRVEEEITAAYFSLDWYANIGSVSVDIVTMWIYGFLY